MRRRRRQAVILDALLFVLHKSFDLVSPIPVKVGDTPNSSGLEFAGIDARSECIEELERLKVTHEKTLEAMNLKDDEISFFRGHVSQLTQSISQLALPPSQEEARAKSWWRFWK
jgi:hypothetical protein